MKITEPIIKDKNFEIKLREILNISNDILIEKEYLYNIQKLDLSNLEIVSLEGIENFKRLSSLDISNNPISDISFLSNLKLDLLIAKKLEKIKNFDILSEIKTVKKLNLSKNFIDDLNFLSLFPKLEILYLNDIYLDDFSDLPALETVRKLSLEYNFLENLENPPKIPNLEEFYLSKNSLTYLDGIETFEKLTKLRISYNKIENLDALKNFKSLRKLYMSENEITDLAPLKDMEITEKLALAKNNIVITRWIDHLIKSDLPIYGLDELGIIQLTKEQKGVVNYRFESNILKINAYAGTGKTTTAINFIKNHKPSRNQKVLYLTYNRSIRDDVMRKLEYRIKEFVDVRTAHSLALSNLKVKVKLFSLTTTMIRDYCFFNKEDKKEALKDARVVENFLNFYFNSSFSYSPKDLLEAFENYINTLDKDSEKKENSYYEYILLGATKLLVYLVTKFINHETTHDFYLKLFHLRIRDYLNRLNNRYQYVIFDEAQDASAVMFDMLLKMSCKKIFIGDTHQEIYSFRYAINSLEKIDTISLDLTNSFRFGKNIANLSNKIVALKGVESDIKGVSNFKDKISFYKFEDGLIDGDNFTVISRTNITLFKLAKEAVKRGQQIAFEGDYDNYPFASTLAKSIHYLKHNDFSRITNNFIKNFNNIWSLKSYSVEVQDIQLFNLISLIMSEEDFLKSLKIIKNNIISKERAEIIFTTVHKSKGVEYDKVMIVEDFKVEPSNLFNQPEEINLLYVAVTRVKKELFLPSSYKGLLEIDKIEMIKKIKLLNQENSTKNLNSSNRMKLNISLSKLVKFEQTLHYYYGLPLSNTNYIEESVKDIIINLHNKEMNIEFISSVTGITSQKIKDFLESIK